jgi:1-pyrroline-5-carboxylate dehydrogenase
MLTKLVGEIKQGPVEDFTNFVGPVIDEAAFKSITGYLDRARKDPEVQFVCGGEYDSSKGYYIQPTILESSSHSSEVMTQEIFGPVLTVHCYDNLESHLSLMDQSSHFSLTGAMFCKDRAMIDYLCSQLRHTAGNFYVNDKSTGAIVGQQPFGGGRASGTNDKSGSKHNLLRWTMIRSIKENFSSPLGNFKYPFMQAP